MAALDPYNRGEVLDACAKHAWKEREEELRQHGFDGVDELRAHIDKTVEGQHTRAFVCQPQEERGQVLQREIYNAPFDGHKSEKPYETTIVLNPNQGEQGHIYGGTCMIRGEEKKDFNRLQAREAEKIGVPPQVIEGGRPALREQQAHQQITKVDESAEHVHQQASPHELQFFEDKPKQAQPEAAMPVKETSGLQFYEDSAPTYKHLIEYLIKR